LRPALGHAKLTPARTPAIRNRISQIVNPYTPLNFPTLTSRASVATR
jgi:hypothetical protein